MPEDKTKTDPGQGQNSDLKVLVDGMKAIAESVKTMQGNFTTLQEDVNSIRSGVQTKSNPNEGSGEDKKKQQIAAADLERMSRPEFANWLVGEIQDVFKGEIDSLKTQFTSHAQETNNERVNQEVASARSKYKDFDEWQKEILTVGKANPKLTIEQMYILAKNDNPEKVKELSEKYPDETQQSNNNKNQGDGEKPPTNVTHLDQLFGGFEPAQSGGKEDTTSLDADAAAHAAFDDVIGGLSDNIGET